MQSAKEITQALLNGDHLNKEELERAKAIVRALNIELKNRKL